MLKYYLHLKLLTKFGVKIEMKKIFVIALIALLVLGALTVTVVMVSQEVSALGNLYNCDAIDKVCWDGNTVDGCTKWKYYCAADL